MDLASVEEALRRIRRGEMVLVVDDEDRENEGDLTMAASWVTPEAINFMLRWARGLVCMPCAPERLDALCLTPMVPPEHAGCDTAFTVSIDHVEAGSGIGAADRALTIRRAVQSPARVPDLAAFADDHRIAMVTVDQVAEQRRAIARRHERAPAPLLL